MPNFLSKGDLIIIAPSARFVLPEDMNRVKSFLQGHGFKVDFAQGLFERFHQFAGDDEQRAASLQWALDHPKAKAILMARGGYGSVRIIDQIDFSTFKKNPKILIGFSDVTALHVALNNMGHTTLHGPLASTLMKHSESAEYLINAIIGNHNEIYLEGHPMNRPGIIEGEIVGGNLSILISMSGSRTDIDINKKILFIEDVDEYLYHIDRMMYWLDRSGKLRNIRGLLVGGFSAMKDHEIPFGWSAYEIIFNVVKKYKFPVAFGLPFGHEDRNLSLFLGRKTEVQITKDAVKITYI